MSFGRAEDLSEGSEREIVNTILQSEVTAHLKTLYGMLSNTSQDLVQQDHFFTCASFLDVKIDARLLTKIFQLCNPSDQSDLLSLTKFEDFVNALDQQEHDRQFEPIDLISQDMLQNLLSNNQKDPERSFSNALAKIQSTKSNFLTLDALVADGLKNLNTLNSMLKNTQISDFISKFQEIFPKEIFTKNSITLQTIETEINSLFNSGQFYHMIILKQKASKKRSDSKMQDDYDAFANLISRLEQENEGLHSTVNDLVLKLIETDRLKEKLERKESESYEVSVSFGRRLRERGQQLEKMKQE
jgi:hypothetical protein